MIKKALMPKLNELAGFTVAGSSKFFCNGRLCRIGNPGVEAVEFAVELLELRKKGHSLIPQIEKIRNLKSTDCKLGLCCLITNTPNSDLRIIAIWLRGLCGGYVGSQIIAKFAQQGDEITRRVSTKAMQRMAVWSELDLIAQNDSSDRVRRLAASRPARRFTDRLSRFTENVEAIPYSPKQKDLFWSSLIDLKGPIRTKSVEFIRQVLLRIHKLVENGKAKRQ